MNPLRRTVILLSWITVMLSLPAGSLAWAADAASSNTPGIRVGSLEWQRIDLETKLQDRVHQAILKVIPEKLFNASVSITLKKIEPQAVTENKKDKKNTESEDSRINLGKLDFDVPLMADSEEDSYLDSSGERRKLRVINLFDQLEKVTVSVLIDTSIPDTKKDLITKLTQGVTAALGQNLVTTTIDKADLYTPKQFSEPWDTPRWISELKIPVAIVGATLIIVLFMSLVLLSAFNGYFRIESRKTAILESQNAREAAAEEARMTTLNPTPGQATSSSETGSAPPLETNEKGFDRFKALLAQDPEKMANLVRQWVRSPGRGATEALVILPQVLSTAECLQLFKYLKEDDRKEWKKALSTPVDERSSQIAENFISFQIVDSLLIPPSTTDEELQKLLSGLGLAECIEIANQDVNLGALLLDLLPTAQAGRLYSIMSRDLADSLASAVLQLSDEQIQAQSANLKQAIQTQLNKKKAVPFLDRAAELVSALGPDREEMILKALAEAGEFQLLEATAKQFFPAELILRLPSAALKTCLDRYPTPRRAELILSRDTAERTTLLDSVGRPASKARELLDIEIQNIQVDEVRTKRIEKSRALIWKDFITTVRTLVQTNETVGELSKDTLSDWLSEKTAGQYRGSNGEAAA